MFSLSKSFGRVARIITNKSILQQSRFIPQIQVQNRVSFGFAETIQHSKDSDKNQYESKGHNEVSSQLLHKLIKVFISSPHIKLSPQITKEFVEGIQQRVLPQSIFSSIIELLIVKQNEGDLQGINRLQLLKQMTLALQTRINSQSYELIQKSKNLSQWIIETNQKSITNDQQRFELTVFSLTTGHMQIFGQNLILIKNQEKIIQTLLYLEQCPQLYRDAVVAYLKTLPISADLRARLAEFTGSNTDPASVDTS